MNCEAFVIPRGVSPLVVFKRAVYSGFMSHITLRQYIRQMGIEAFCAKYGVRFHTANSWAYGNRRPNLATARRIVANSPVTYDGIYFPNESGSDVPAKKGIA